MSRRQKINDCLFAAPGGILVWTGHLRGMALLLRISDLENGILLRCEGRIVCGPESEELESRVRRLLPAFRNVVLELSGVTFVDSSGLGLLVRLMASSRSAGGDLKLASPSRQVAKLLETTCLTRAFQLFHSPEEALSAYLSQRTVPQKPGNRVLCVDPSYDVSTFVRTVLRAVGYSVLTTDNFVDARLLLRASAPDLVVLGPNVDPQRAKETLREHSAGISFLALNADFQRLEAGEASAILLAQVQKATGNSSG